MASLHLSTVVFNLASDLTQVLVLADPHGIPTQINPSPQTPGEDRMYGKGRYRGVSGGPTQKQHALTFAAVDPATLQTLRDWDGQMLCYRDDSGEKYYGKYRSPQITRHSYDLNADVSLTFTQSSHSEAV